MTDSLSIAIHAFVSRESMSFSVDETLLPMYVNLSTSFSCGNVACLIKAHIFSFVCIDMEM